VLKIVFLIH